MLAGDRIDAGPVRNLPRQHGAHASVLSVVAEGGVVIDHTPAGKKGGLAVAASALPQVQQQESYLLHAATAARMTGA